MFITFAAISLFSALFYISAVKSNSIAALSPGEFFQKRTGEAPEYQPGMYTTIIDDQENILSMMSRAVYAGDEIYTSEGKIYRLEKVQGDLASARFMGVDPQITAFNEFFTSQEVPVTKEKSDNTPAPPASFAIYHTHTGESYIPSDGTQSIRFKGGIYKVGTVMAERLRKIGMEVNHDQTAHDPHDNNAYVRSRRTAAKLLSTNPAAMFDVHRDGVVDPNFYREKVSGQDVAAIRIVVGRQNPRMSANLDFAKQMLAAVNNVHPKVVKEIFVGKGDYNQDLLPTALLIEAGTYTNSREEAERGVDLFAEALPQALGISPVSPAPTGAASPGKSTGASGGAWKAVGWILGFTVLGGLAFLLISNVKLSDAKKMLIDFSREVIPLLPRQAARKLGIGNENKKSTK
ncbi:stage II sporulation protein P [Pelotomaculum propionicicum]|uniref:stage II sporulation protein P n=1 Tax=Pelotomaculum propionicicum TaxID=258475 RepID=UPI003BA0857C